MLPRGLPRGHKLEHYYGRSQHHFFAALANAAAFVHVVVRRQNHCPFILCLWLTATAVKGCLYPSQSRLAQVGYWQSLQRASTCRLPCWWYSLEGLCKWHSAHAGQALQYRGESGMAYHHYYDSSKICRYTNVIYRISVTYRNSARYIYIYIYMYIY